MNFKLDKPQVYKTGFSVKHNSKVVIHRRKSLLDMITISTEKDGKTSHGYTGYICVADAVRVIEKKWPDIVWQKKGA